MKLNYTFSGFEFQPLFAFLEELFGNNIDVWVSRQQLNPPMPHDDTVDQKRKVLSPLHSERLHFFIQDLLEMNSSNMNRDVANSFSYILVHPTYDEQYP